MIISELNYQEIATEAGNLEGGKDLAINFTHYFQELSVIQSGATSGPNGSVAVANAQHLKIDTTGFSAIVLGA